MNKRRPPAKKMYNQTIGGVYGEFGSGANTRVFYLQSAIRPTDIDKTTLISDISGSERWEVRDLFQREVDVTRVTKGLLPYLQNPDQVKFFNPLTLTMLPYDASSNQILSDMPEVAVTVNPSTNDSPETVTIEMKGFYRYQHDPNAPEWAMLEWNDTRVKLVAIDGQHRLSALKRFARDRRQDSDFQEWSIPVVIIAFRPVEGSAEKRSILEVVRSIFININTQARKPNRARQILLSDNSITAVAAQELLQVAHVNDLLPDDQRVPHKVPLLFYDWRGEEDDGRRIQAPASVKTIEEIEDWFKYYLIGEDFTDKQEIALGIQPLSPLKASFLKKQLDVESSREVRRQLSDTVLPAVCHLLENFTPYKDYTSALRELEATEMTKSDFNRHAFYWLRFGEGVADSGDRKAIEDLYKEQKDNLVSLQKVIRPPLDLDVGMRGVVCAFGELRQHFNSAKGKVATWLEYARWFTAHLNAAYQGGWFNTTSTTGRANLKHIIIDHNEQVTNYRLENAADAFGAFVAILVSAFGYARKDVLDEDRWLDIWELFSDRLLSTLVRGYKKEVRPALKEKYPKGGTPLSAAVKNEAEKMAGKHLARFERAVDKITG